MREYLLNFSQLEIYEAGAFLLALLAYPEHGSAVDENRGALHRSLCALALHQRRQKDPAWAAEPQPIRPVYACCHPRSIARDCRTLIRRLRDRLAAGWMLQAFLCETLRQAPPPSLRGMPSLSLGRLSEALASEGIGINNADSVEARVWRPSVPVVHLAAATGIVARNASAGSLLPSLPESFLTSRSFIESVVQSSANLAALVPHVTRLRLSPAELIQVRLS